jgi:hypothetical protein
MYCDVRREVMTMMILLLLMVMILMMVMMMTSWDAGFSVGRCLA